MSEYIIVAIFSLIGIIFLVILVYLLLNYFNNKSNKNLQQEIILVKIPKYTKQQKDEHSKDYVQTQLGQVENLFAALSGLRIQKKFFGKRTDVFSAEIVSDGGFINFYIATPANYRDLCC